MLINLLPNTPQTVGIINRELLSQLAKDAYVINLARGVHLVEADLLAALDTGQLKGAMLDVFSKEPLAGKITCYGRIPALRLRRMLQR
ncbi:Glyoxylate/hydroxypyruvate reductase A [Cedecea neteri]|uniref:Glyoxylate/hydroxypyruvate reductase A n=1 Tax=Cedecea neteri TaxID=158822 RepID=A0A2X3JGP6_9ENTR|nr:Glyoxylate/hydroxypyruvate reductase A [Cedecea neteri]